MSKLCLRVPNFPGKDKLMAKGAVVAAKVSQKSPELCVAGAIVCGITGTVLACRATLKVESVLDAYNEKMEKIHQGEELQTNGELDENNQYPAEKAQRDKTFAMAQFGIDILRLYAPALIFGTMSVGFILGSYKILSQRNATLLVAYESLQKAYDAYRQRVREEIGEERENDIFKGVRQIEIEDEKGKKKKAYELEQPYSPYARIFDEGNKNWVKDVELNKFFLARQQAFANDMLQLRGHVFLNEVLDMLGFERTPMGQDVGWLKHGDGDGFISFGIWDATKEGSRRFVNGVERCVWLDFNCDGFIKDKI